MPATKLKRAIFESERTQRELAKRCGIPENRFSSIVNGWVEARQTERTAIALALSRPVGQLFERATA